MRLLLLLRAIHSNVHRFLWVKQHEHRSRKISTPCTKYQTELCDLNCGAHGKCVGETCTCDNGWGGEFCNTKLCDARCNEHGQCKNGTCLCVTGWNGKHCTIEGCPASCSNHGQCRVSGEGLWECRCYDGWDGTDCSVALEQNCADNKDNDKGKLNTYDSWCVFVHMSKFKPQIPDV